MGYSNHSNSDGEDEDDDDDDDYDDDEYEFLSGKSLISSKRHGSRVSERHTAQSGKRQKPSPFRSRPSSIDFESEYMSRPEREAVGVVMDVVVGEGPPFPILKIEALSRAPAPPNLAC